ncbi:MAG: 2-phospho-L-lactate guanylyltransferase [Pseudomonadota bacterium]
MTLWVLIPVKRFADSKSRLASHLGPKQRIRLAEAMLRDTLSTVSKVDDISGIALVTADPQAAKVGRAAGAVVLDDDAPDLNGALTSGREQLFLRYGPIALLILPIDLPALRQEDVESVVRAGRNPGAMVIVADDRRDGTNALLLGPDVDLTFAYGPGSYARHRASAQTAGLQPTVLQVPGIAFDLDAPADLNRMPKSPIGAHIGALLAGLEPSNRNTVERAS